MIYLSLELIFNSYIHICISELGYDGLAQTGNKPRLWAIANLHSMPKYSIFKIICFLK